VDCVIRKSGGLLFVSAGKKFFYKKIKEGRKGEREKWIDEGLCLWMDRIIAFRHRT